MDPFLSHRARASLRNGARSRREGLCETRHRGIMGMEERVRNIFQATYLEGEPNTTFLERVTLATKLGRCDRAEGGRGSDVWNRCCCQPICVLARGCSHARVGSRVRSDLERPCTLSSPGASIGCRYNLHRSTVVATGRCQMRPVPATVSLSQAAVWPRRARSRTHSDTSAWRSAVLVERTLGDVVFERVN